MQIIHILQEYLIHKCELEVLKKTIYGIPYPLDTK